jgi:hypothetical protein
MKQYRGYYIDHVVFNSKEDIDNFLEKQAVEAHNKACKYFADHPSMEASNYCMEKAEYLVKQFGYTWEQVEALEIAAITQ